MSPCKTLILYVLIFIDYNDACIMSINDYMDVMTAIFEYYNIGKHFIYNVFGGVLNGILLISKTWKKLPETTIQNCFHRTRLKNTIQQIIQKEQ